MPTKQEGTCGLTGGMSSSLLCFPLVRHLDLDASTRRQYQNDTDNSSLSDGRAMAAGPERERLVARIMLLSARQLDKHPRVFHIVTALHVDD